VFGGELDDSPDVGTENDARDDAQSVGSLGHHRGKGTIVVAVSNFHDYQPDAERWRDLFRPLDLRSGLTLTAGEHGDPRRPGDYCLE